MLELDSLATARRIAGFGLAGFADAPAPDIRADSWDELLRVLCEQRLTGLAVAAEADGWLRLAAAQTECLMDKHREAMVWNLALERLLLELTGRFEAAGLQSVVLKGSALAHAFYPDASWRAYGDLDVLVRTSDWRAAASILEEAGFRRDLPEPRPGFDERFGKAASHTNERGHQVDLHRTLVLGPFGLWMDPEELFRRTTAFELGPRTLRRLDDTASMLHACMHAVLGAWPPLLLPSRDVAQVAERGEIDWDELGELAARWRLRAVVGHALRMVRVTMGARLPEGSRPLADAVPTSRERRILEAYTTRRRGRGATALTVIRCIPGVRARASYVRAMLVPDRDFLVARGEHGASPSYIRRWLVPVRWLTGRRYRG